MDEQLSEREKACLTWVARGKSSGDIGKILAISENTVNFHIKNAMNKLATNRRTVAAVKAAQLGLIAPATDLRPTRKTLAIEPAGPGPEHRDPHTVAVDAPSRRLSICAPLPSVPLRLRVGVAPFLATGTVQDSALAFSLSEDIAAAVARFRWFDVIAPMSLKRGPTEFVLSDDVLRRKKLDYVITGTLAGDGNRFSVNFRVLDLISDAQPVWSGHFKIEATDQHHLDELVMARVAGQIVPAILTAEGQPGRRTHCDASGLVLLAIPLLHTAERAKFNAATRLVGRALQLEPDNSMAAAWAAHAQTTNIGQGWARDRVKAVALAQKFALKAMALDPHNAEAMAIYAHICSFLHGDFESALEYFDRALRLNPNSGFIWALSAPTYCYVGKPELALRRLQRYRELTPVDHCSWWCENFFTIAHLFNGDYDRAISTGRRGVKVHPGFTNAIKPLIASLGHQGRRDEAKPYIDRLLTLEPDFTVEHFARIYPFKMASDRERYIDGLRLAGMPST
jgi:DNA-binding CsgD family transcriptional regulator/TolB-like protein/tetratricopeptide (TPR) repeat protein